MKRIIFIAALMLTTLLSFAQEGAKDVYAKYSKVKNATSVYISPSMFNLIGNISIDADIIDDDTAKDFLPLVRQMRGLYLIECENKQSGKEMFEDALKYAKSSNMELQMEVNDDGDHIKLYTEADKDIISDFLFLVESDEDDEYVMINILGEISRKELSEYINRMNRDD